MIGTLHNGKLTLHIFVLLNWISCKFSRLLSLLLSGYLFQATPLAFQAMEKKKFVLDYEVSVLK